MDILQTASDNLLQGLRQLLPIQGLIHVGIGSGSALNVYEQWDIPAALFLEAEPQLHAQIEHRLEARQNWESANAVVADEVKESTFYISNNPREHSLIEPESLSFIWHNLKTIETQTVNTQTLANILTNKKFTPVIYNWLVIDCLSSIEIIKGLGNYTEQIDVVIARSILNEGKESSVGKRNGLDSYLTDRAFHAINIYEENNPAIGYILYVRDHKEGIRRQQQRLTVLTTSQTETDKQLAALQQTKNETDEQLAMLQQAKAEADKTNHELKAQTQSLTQARDEQAKLASERQQQLSTLQNAKTETDKQLTALQQTKAETDKQLAALQQAKNETDKQLAALQQAKAEADKTNHELKTQTQSLTHARDEQAKLASERQQQLSTLQNTKTETDKQLTALQQTKAETDKQLAALQQAKNETDKQLAALQQAKAETDKQLAALQQAKNETDKQLAALQQAKAETDKANREQQAKTQSLTQAWDEQTKLASERQQQLITLQNAKAEVDKQLTALQQTKADAQEAHKQECERIKKERNEQKDVKEKMVKEFSDHKQIQTHKLNELQGKYNALQKQHHDKQTQLDLLKAELIKAEAQITLIKDIFFQNNPFQFPRG